MPTYTITVNNRLYQVVDNNTERIIATFISENDAQTFIQTIYAKMFQEQKEIISNKLFLSKKGEDFINKAISGTEKIEEETEEEFSDEFDDNFDEEDKFDDNIEESEDFDDVSSDDDADTGADFESGEWEEKTLETSPNDDDFMELTMQKFSSPNPEYWNIIEKPSLLNNYDDNSLGEAASYDSVGGKTELVQDLTFTIEDNNRDFNVVETSNNVEIKQEIEPEPMDFEITESKDVDDGEMVTIDTTQVFDDKPKFNLDNEALDTTKNDSLDLSNIYKDFLHNELEKENIENSSNETEIEAAIIENIDLTNVDSTVDVIDLGPFREEDEIFSTPRADAIDDLSIEKDILSGKISLLSPREQKKEDKRRRKEEKRKKGNK